MSPSADVCLALVASLCITEPATIEISKSTLLVAAVVRIQNTELRSTMASDNVLTPLRRRMERRCDHGQCYFYSVTCAEHDKDTGRVVCNLYYEVANSGELKRIEIISPNASEQRSVLSTVYFVPYPNTLVPFSTLRFTQAEAPICLPRRDGDC